MPIDLFIFISIIIAKIRHWILELITPDFILSGITKDIAGVPVDGVALMLVNINTAEVVNATSGADGSYSFSPLKAGAYSLSGQKALPDGAYYHNGGETIVISGPAGEIKFDLTLV